MLRFGPALFIIYDAFGPLMAPKALDNPADRAMTIGIALTPFQLAYLDAKAAEMHVSRSKLTRMALAHFIGLPGGAQ